MTTTPASTLAQQYCTFLLDDHLFGVPVSSVQEVLRAQEVTPVPLSAPEVSGLINLRGQIVTSVELRRRLGLPARVAGAASVNIVVTSSDGTRVSLVVDEIGDVLEPPREAFEAAPDTVPPLIRPLVDGVCKLDDRLMLVLDTELAVTFGGNR